MTKVDYYKYVDKIIADGILPERKIFRFPTSGYFHEVYNDIFNFFLLEFGMNIKEKRLDEKTFVVYIDDHSVNAFAGKAPEFKIIGIYAGIIETMYYFFDDRKEIFATEDFQPFEISCTKFNGHAAFYVLFRYMVLFTFFHELGHIFQNVGTTSHFEENLTNTASSAESFEKHKKEYDADMFACIKMLTYIKGDFENKVAKEDQTKETLLNIASVAISAMMTFFYQSASTKGPIYYEETSHPHPLIRLSYLLESVANNLNGLSNQFTIETEEIFERTFKIVGRLVGLNDKQLYQEIIDNHEGIKAYIGLLEETQKLPGYAYNMCYKKLTLGAESAPHNVAVYLSIPVNLII